MEGWTNLTGTLPVAYYDFFFFCQIGGGKKSLILSEGLKMKIDLSEMETYICSTV